MVPTPVFIVACNQPGIELPPGHLSLDYRADSSGRNLSLELPRFVIKVGHLPNRLLDFLEIAAYVYAADRYSSRGSTDAVEYHSWSRTFDFHIRVRDHQFWSSNSVRQALSSTLTFMTGDRAYDFTFYPGHTTPPTSLFDQPESLPDPEAFPPAISLFSGGLDSLAGAVSLLTETDNNVFLISHQSQPGTKRTQNRLVAAFRKNYGTRVGHYSFQCNLTGVRAREESQRSRSFLYGSIACAVASAYKTNAVYMFENGVTSINLARRQDLLNARASRTTHPRLYGV